MRFIPALLSRIGISKPVLTIIGCVVVMIGFGVFGVNYASHSRKASSDSGQTSGAQAKTAKETSQAKAQANSGSNTAKGTSTQATKSTAQPSTSAGTTNTGNSSQQNSSTPSSGGGQSGSSSPQFFTTVASGQCARSGGCTVANGLPRSDSYCAANVTATTWEPRADNYTANHTQGPSDPATISWGVNAISGYWLNTDANTRLVDGHYTGLTTQVIQWAACKWGINEDIIRAVAVQESDWHQNVAGDVANGCAHSFGIIQVRDSPNSACPINHSAFGGMPYTQSSTALALDFYGATFRSCYDGGFYDGGAWLYGGQTVTQVAAAHGWDYVLWGCVGSWYSGDWYDSGAQTYINNVKTWYANKTWTSY